MKHDHGKTSGPSTRRFVVLFHVCREGDHYDLMIENGETLATWKLNSPPEQAVRDAVQAFRIGEHRRLYLDYEGPISGNRGDVRQYDSGQCQVISLDECWQVQFEGKHLSGWFELRHMDQSSGDWELRRLRA